MVTIGLILISAVVIMTFYLAIRRKIHTLSILLLAGGVFMFMYVIQPIISIHDGTIYYFIDDWQIAKCELVAFIMYLFLLWGWFSGMKGPIKAKRILSEISWNYRRLYAIGFLMAAFGAAVFSLFVQESGGFNTFYSAPHFAKAAWHEETAYVYDALYLVYPGLVLMILGCVRSKSRAFRWFPIILFSLLMLAHSILSAARGVFFPLVASVGLAYYLGGKKMPKTRTVVIGGAIAGLAVLLLVGYRGVLHLGPSDPYRQPSFNEALLSVAGVGGNSAIKYKTTGNEFIYSASIIDTVDSLQEYNLGINYIYKITVHLIPRLFWPDKPYSWGIPEIYKPHSPENGDFYQTFGYKVAGGSAPTIVGELYMQFGLASVLFFFLLGRFSAYLFKKLQVSDDPRVITAYVMWYAFGLHLFAQGFEAVIEPYIYTMVPTLLVMNFARSRSSRYAGVALAVCSHD